MKAFQISEDQIVSVIAALVAERMGRMGARQADSLTQAGWRAETSFGAGGVGLNEIQYSACVDEIAAFFGIALPAVPPLAHARIGDLAELAAVQIAEGFTQITFTPAGRGEAGGCVHQADHIYADAAAAANLFYGRRRVLSLVAPHSLLGFTLTVITPNLQRIPKLDVRSMTPEALQAALSFGDALVATPTLWRYILQEGVSAPDNTMGVYFGEPMSPELAADMRQAGFAAQREIYGSTETGIIGWRDGPTDPFILFDHWRRDEDALVRHTDEETAIRVAPMDVIEWSDERRFFLAGRRDGAVQIGAINVFPETIAQTLQRHSDVEDCIIRVGKHKGGVNRLIAHIKLKDDAPPSEKTARDIDLWCRESLRPQERPGIYHFEETLSGL